MKAGNDSAVGLIGGSIEQRVGRSRVPPVDHPLVLAPFRTPSDVEVLRNFCESGPLHVEIGFARAHHLVELAEAHPDIRVLGFEIRRAFCRQAARRAERLGLKNLRVIEGDCRPFIDRLFTPGSVRSYYVYFPDPWWKRKHHKRRVFSSTMLNHWHDTLTHDGDVIAKTDVPAYADLILELFEAHDGFKLTGCSDDDALLAALPRTHREKKCAELNIPSYKLRFTRETLR